MAAIIKERDRRLLSRKFERELQGNVRLIVFTKKPEEENCKIMRQIVEEVSGLSERLLPEYYDIEENSDKASRWSIDKTPALLLFGEKEYGVRFFGLPAGYEFTTLIEDIVDVSKGKSRLAPTSRKRVSAIATPLHIQVFVTPTCPYCPRAVRIAHEIAVENLNVKSDMIEATEFPELSAKYQVMAVPKIVINDRYSFEGALPEPYFINYVLAVVEGKVEELPSERYRGTVTRV